MQYDKVKNPKKLASIENFLIFGLPALLILLFISFDHIPRFLQGDSVSYIMTGVNGWIPPDRSWFFGYIVHDLLKATGTYKTYIILNNILLFLIIVPNKRYFLRYKHSIYVYVVLVLFLTLDPMIAFYARSYLSDFLGLVFFAGFIITFRTYLRSQSVRFDLIGLMFILATSAIFTRLAYVVIIGLMVFIVAFWGYLHSSRRLRNRAATMIFLPCASFAALLMANSIIFSAEFGPKPFANKLSGTFLLGVFGPAVNNEDFHQAGVFLSDKEFADLDLSNYDKRLWHVWGTGDTSAHALIKSKLGVKNDYDDLTENVSSKVVRNAFLRDPIGILKVYAYSFYIYFIPSEWSKNSDRENGVDRILDDSFVDYMNGISTPKIFPEIVKENSISLYFYSKLLSVYPLFIALFLIISCYNIIRKNGNIDDLIISASFLSALMAAPLYSNYVIPRYVIVSVFFGYVLFARLLDSSLNDLIAIFNKKRWLVEQRNL